MKNGACVGSSSGCAYPWSLFPNMKTKSRLIFVLSAFACCLASPLAQGSVAVGDAAPDFSVADLNGAMHKLSDYRGRTVVLEWNNPDCPFVKKNYEKSGHLPALQKAATADGVVWLILNSGAPGKEGGDYTDAQLKTYLENNHAAATAYLPDHDGKVGRLYGAKTTPHLFVITATGRVAYQGAVDSIRSADPADLGRATDYVKEALEAVKAGKPVTHASTEPYGCSVKY